MSRTIADLRQKQGLPLSTKVLLTQSRIRQWVNEYGMDGVYVAFSGGKDSTVLCDIIDRMYPNNSIPKIFSNTGLEYPEVVSFAKTKSNVVMIRPKMTFKQVITKYGYPFISKEVAQTVYEAKKGYPSAIDRLNGEGRLKGTLYTLERWKFMMAQDAPPITHMCCHVTKKRPAHAYQRQTGRVPMTGEMAQESLLRRSNWLRHGCNGFDMKSPKSTPMAFWTEQDVLKYIKENHIEIASVYGDVVADTRSENVATGQMRIEDFIGGDCKLRTTGCARTGCMFCGFGCHLEKPGEGRFLRMKQTHPKLYEYIMKPWDQGGLGYKEVIDWINEHGNLHIEY